MRIQAIVAVVVVSSLSCARSDSPDARGGSGARGGGAGTAAQGTGGRVGGAGFGGGTTSASAGNSGAAGFGASGFGGGDTSGNGGKSGASGSGGASSGGMGAAAGAAGGGGTRGGTGGLAGGGVGGGGSAGRGVCGGGSGLRIDAKSPGRIFDGIGALSAGASSRLLIDYPEPQRREILDYLFKPAFGAALSILKVEIGGDANSTDGSEPSHEPVKGQEDYQRGYEWWLMKEAKARNANIKLAALAWAAPGWIGNGTFASQDNTDFQIRWIQHAKTDHGLTLDYVGAWNERQAKVPASWLIAFKQALQTSGIKAQFVAPDDFGWDIATAIQGNAALKSAVDILGSHYTCGYLKTADSCNTTSAAQQSGKQLWASEDGSQHYSTGAGPLAKALNRVYIDGKMTGFINWSLIWSAYANLPFSGAGLMLANTPWSGYYEVGKSIWVLAHTTQFAQPGWQYLDTASGYLATQHGMGSYVALRSPSGGDYSLIVETVDATTDQPFGFTPVGGFGAGPIHVWRTDINSTNPADYFKQLPDLEPSNCTYSTTLKRGSLYTFTTTSGQGKGATTPPVDRPMAIPFADDFESYKPSQEARYFADMNGAFVAAPCAGGRSGICLAQTVPLQPIEWSEFIGVQSMVGDPTWTDYAVQADVLLQQTSAAQILGRQSTASKTRAPGYVFQVADSGSWRLFMARADNSEQNLATGSGVRVGMGTWHTLKLVFQGPNIAAWIDGTMVATVRDTTYAKGNAGVGVGGWTLAQFDNFSVSNP